jgi:hypothetical protein
MPFDDFCPFENALWLLNNFDNFYPCESA